MTDKPPVFRPLKLSSVAYSLVITTLVIICLIYFDNIIKPLVLATMFWFLIKILKEWLGKLRIRGKEIPRGLRGFLALFIISAIIFLLYEMISVQISQIGEQSPVYREKFLSMYNDFSNNLNNPEIMAKFSDRVRNFDYGKTVAGFVNSLSGFLGDFAVVLIYIVFMLLEEGATQMKIERLFPGKGPQFDRFVKISEKINDSIKSYFSSKTVISLWTGVFSYIILVIFGVDFAAFWSLFIFILNYIPYIGSFIATAFPAIFAVFQFGDPLYFVYVFAAIQVVQLIMGNVVEPRIMGKSLNLSPLTVIVALAVWGSLWGIVGMILAVPLTAMLIIIFAQFDSTKYIAVLLSEQGEVD